MGWLSRLFGSEPAASAPAGASSMHPAVPAPAGAAQAQPPEPTQAADRPPFLCWLFELPVAEQAFSAPERQALAQLDALLRQPTLPPELLPRAASVVPQLIGMLRQESLPVAAMAERIGRDPAIAAEVLRLAGSAHFRAQGPVQDLPQAIQRLGTEGLQMAISRVLLRPMYQAGPGSVTAAIAPRLWEHADTLSRHSSTAARSSGLSGFDGYLAGLLYDSGWTVLFHALQRAGQAQLRRFSAEAALAFEARAHQLFGRVALGWAITPAFTAFAADACRTPLERSSDPMAVALRAAQAPCMDELKLI